MVVTIVTLLFFLGATGKSAQIPLYTWLPDAMEGPTPVSALIHAATMVTAGVYMIGRMNGLFAMAPDTMMVIAIIGAATAIFAASIGFAQNDIKRVLAYSTVSQLGYMFLAMGVGAFTAGVFHLMTHAFFKACLFLGSGSVIHAMHHGLHHAHLHDDPQDMRNMGGLRKKMPITYWTFFASTLAISGVPLLLRLLLQGRNPLVVLRLDPRCLGPVAGRRPRRRHDRLLHVPLRVDDLLGRAAHQSQGQGPHPRVAAGDYLSADGPRPARRDRRLCRRPGALRQGLEPLRTLPRPGLR